MNFALAKISNMYPNKDVTLIVRNFNQRAITIYQNVGFKVIREDYEETSTGKEKILVMKKEKN